MSDELSEIVRGAARAEADAAEREFPFSPSTVDRFVRDVRRRRAAGAAMLTVAAVTVVGAGALGLVQLWPAAPTVVSPFPAATSSASPDVSATTTPTVEPSTSPTPSVSPSPSSTPTVSSAPPTATPTPTTTPTVAVPGQVTGVTAGAGGGSGEIMVWWDPVAGATGYRVYRSALPDGPFMRSASFDVATGRTTIEADFPYEFIGMEPSWPDRFEYVDAIPVSGPAYFKVTALSSGGESVPSVVVCGTPIGGPPC